MIPACAVDIDANTHAVTTVNISKINMVGYSCLEDGVLNYSDFTPKNNKLLTYPYIFLHGTNFEGQTNDYHYEYFSNLSNLLFMFACNISMSPTAILWPVNYKGVVDNYDEGITLQNFPQCPWTSDFFKNWFVQNCVSTITGAAASGVSLAAGAMTANPVAVAGGVIEAANVMGEIAKHAVVPANARGNGGDGSLQIALGTKGVGFGKFRIRKEYAQKIDNFFEMYGYKVNNVKVPNVNSRPYWNYVKTIDCNITGDIPNKDMQKLKSIYNAGVTIWHGATNMYNYSLNNH
jgi:hypothetical protein